MRLDEINKLKKKYGESLEKIMRSRAQAQAELERIASNEAELEKVAREQQKIEKETMRLAMDLSHQRSQVAPQLSEKVKDELVSLGMKKALFTAKLIKERGEAKAHARGFVPLGDFTLNERGLDEAEFLFGPNPGEGLKPLAKIASGGELSRIILALKKIVAGTRGGATLIFDEVDSGIGGATAEVVGRKLKEISRWQQTICITHLPQIASFADLHQTIAKQVNKGRTKTFVKQLDSPQEREEEVARMLGGTTITAKTREHAREMLKTAQGMA
jgi:DNA repair protein RecN (Recombination protein N)